MVTVKSGERMLSYYPEVLKTIHEFKAITDVEGYEFDELKINSENVLNNAYLLTMDETRIMEWEKLLNIRPLENSSIDDRRETIVARIRGQGKLNTEMINTIVKTFTDGTAYSWVEDNVLHITITPPLGNKSYQFANVEQELRNKLPAHLGLSVTRNYRTWGEIRSSYPTWEDVTNNFNTWDDVRMKYTE